MYCLVVTDDYSSFTWFFFLASKDETIAILKTFITRIENLVDYKVKVIRCDNGSEFKNREINQFCEMKGIIRQYNVARTPQQNGVAERRNRTLIEAARTMLTDSKLPTTFGHKQLILLAMQVNGKADEGFFFGYSLNGKAFRAFNNRTRIVEENLHIRFSENTPDITGSEPNWLFDIDALTKSISYKPVVTGNQSNGTAELKSYQDYGFQPSSNHRKKVDEVPRQESKCKDQEKEDNVNSTNNVNATSINRVNVVGANTNNELPFDPKRPTLKDIITFNISSDHEVDDEVADMNKLNTTIQTDDELIEKELKQIEADDQAIQTILLGLPEDIYAAVDSCETAQKIWLRTKDLHTADYTKLYDFLKYNQKEVDELKAERLTKIQDPLALMANSNNPYAFPAPHQDQPSFNQNYIQQPMPNHEDITDPKTAMNMALALMAKAFKLNYSTPTNNNQRISSNPRNRQIAQPNVGNLNGYKVVQNVRNQVAQNPRVQNVGNQNGLIGVPGNANLNGNGNLVAARAKGNEAGHNGNQIRCYNCRGVGHFARNCMVRPRRIDLDEIEEVNANCILMANLQQASTSEEQYTELLEPIPNQHQVPHNDNNVISEVSSMELSRETVEQHPANFEETRALYDSLYQNLAIGVEKVNLINRKLKENSFYHTEQKMALGYQNPFYLKQAQKKQQSLYDGKVLLQKYNPLVVHDSEETLQLAQESREKMKQLNKEIKSANYTMINHLSGVFVSQTAKSREELYFSNDSKTANVSKSISIPNEEFLDDTTPSVARKFLNEVKSTIVTLQRVVKHRMTLKTHNWPSSAHQELHKIVKDKNFPIVNQVDAREQNFEIQFLKEAAKFVEDFKSLAKEADESLAKHKTLELEIKRF
uniref:Uncharacterized protein n=1 Tax=Tanacetum cinerariifolium TaxID=118510 RepID=A0A6L2KE26_TANCI|nr:hypothetical protein [Tanacetum cinerariifolium]